MIRQTTMEVIKKTSIDCSFDINEALFPVNCNIDDLSQAIKNIVTNAVQAMKSNGKLEVKATNKKMESMSIQNKSLEEYVCISFKDNGHGISEEDIPNIFDPYFSTRKNVSQKGLGLGLAVVNVIILQHNGFIRVESKLNKGTSVELFFPVPHQN
jgi:signal transduction histidine kinase